MKVYLDNCCFNRPFDDQNQDRIRIETEAKLLIQKKVRDSELMLAWSYILDYENSVNPHEFRKVVIDSWKKRSFIHVTENRRVLTLAKQILKLNLKAKDSLHIACAIEANCDYFITTDDKITSKKPLVPQMQVLNSVELIHRMKEKC